MYVCNLLTFFLSLFLRRASSSLFAFLFSFVFVFVFVSCFVFFVVFCCFVFFSSFSVFFSGGKKGRGGVFFSCLYSFVVSGLVLSCLVLSESCIVVSYSGWAEFLSSIYIHRFMSSVPSNPLFAFTFHSM